MLESANKKIEEAEGEIRSAQHTIEWIKKEIAKIESGDLSACVG
jgi:peptidoglycan hydrolase CwlO-like protein